MTDDELVYTRVLPAPRELVFACLTEPEHLTAFWGPTGTTAALENIVVEPYSGGRFQTLLTSAAGDAHLMRAIFTEVTRPGLLAWTEPTTGMRTTVVLTELAARQTQVRITQRNVPEAARGADARSGFASSLDRFEKYLTSTALET